MPRVPQYQQQVNVQNLPSARERNFITPEVLGADIARGVGQVGNTMAGIWQKEQEKADVAAIMDADRQLAENELRLFNDPETGAYARRGRDTFGLPDQVFPEWDKQVADIEARLTPAQRDAFRRNATARRTDLQRGLSRHILQESERYYTDEAKASLTTAVDSAAANYTDPDRVETEAMRASRAVLAMPSMEGASPIVVNAAIKEARAQVYAGVVERLINTNPKDAVSYFEGVADRLTPAQVARLEPKIIEARNTALAYNDADEALYGTGAAESGDYLGFMRALESGGRADARNPNSTATGADQFIESTWLDMVNSARPAWATGKSREELLAMRTDPLKSAEMAKEYARQNAAKLEAQGLPANNVNLYAAHHFGPGGGVKFAKADDATPIEDILTPEQIAANPYLAGKTKGEVIDNWMSRTGGEREVNEATVLRRLADIEDPDRRRLAESRAMSLLRAKQAAEAQSREDTLNEAYAHIQGGGSVADMPAELRSRIKPTDIATVERYERQRRDELPSNRTTYNEIADLATLRPLDFAKPGVLESQRDKLSDADYDRLLAARREIRAGQDSAFVESRKVQEQITRQVMIQIGMANPPKRVSDPLVPKKGKEEAVTQFRDALASRVDAWAKANGKMPSSVDVQQMADELLVRSTFTERGIFFDSTEEGFEFQVQPLPPNPSDLEDGTIYRTPRGVAMWNADSQKFIMKD